METFNLQVMQKDGSITDYMIQEYLSENKYEILHKDTLIAVFQSEPSGEWTLIDNPGNIEPELEERITGQLNGYRR